MKRHILIKHSKFIRRALARGMSYQHVLDAISEKEAGVKMSVRTLERFLAATRAKRERQAQGVTHTEIAAPMPVLAASHGEAVKKRDSATRRRQVGVVEGSKSSQDIVSRANSYCAMPGGIGVGLKSHGKD